MKKILLSVLVLLVFMTIQAQQKFTINKSGIILDAQWQALKKSRQYQALSRFDTVSKKPLLVYAIYVKNNKLGIINHLGKEVTPPLYDDISGLNISYTTVMFGFHDHYPVVIDKKYGLITNTGKEILPVKYNYITYEKSKDNNKTGVVVDSTFMVNDGGKEYEYNTKGKSLGILADAEVKQDDNSYKDDGVSSYKSPTSKHGKIIRQSGFGMSVIEARVAGKYMYGAVKDNSDTLIVPLEYQMVTFDRHKHIIVMKEKRYAILDSTGKDALGKTYDQIEDFNGILRIKENDKWAFFNGQLKPVSAFEYDYMSSGNGQLMVVKKAGKYGVLNIKAEVLTDFVYDEVSLFGTYGIKEAPFFLVQRNNLFGLLSSTTGKPLTDLDYELITPETAIRTSSGYGGYDEMPGEYRYEESNAYFLIKKGGKYGLLNKDLTPLLVPTYDKIDKSEYQQYVVVTNKNAAANTWLKGVYGIAENKLILPIEFDGSIKYTGSYWMVQHQRKYGLYNNSGKMVLPHTALKDYYIDVVYKGLAKAYNQEVMYYLDQYGNASEVPQIMLLKRR